MSLDSLHNNPSRKHTHIFDLMRPPKRRRGATKTPVRIVYFQTYIFVILFTFCGKHKTDGFKTFLVQFFFYMWMRVKEKKRVKWGLFSGRVDTLDLVSGVWLFIEIRLCDRFVALITNLLRKPRISVEGKENKTPFWIR